MLAGEATRSGWRAPALLAFRLQMPLYEYKCPNGHLVEVIHGMTEASPEVCEVCGVGPVRRVLHPVAVHYKGSGFYSTDYGRKGKKPTKDGGSSESSGGSDGGSSKESGSSSGGDTSGGDSSGGDKKKATEA